MMGCGRVIISMLGARRRSAGDSASRLLFAHGCSMGRKNSPFLELRPIPLIWRASVSWTGEDKSGLTDLRMDQTDEADNAHLSIARFEAFGRISQSMPDREDPLSSSIRRCFFSTSIKSKTLHCLYILHRSPLHGNQYQRGRMEVC